jgi:hypothetical protein
VLNLQEKFGNQAHNFILEYGTVNPNARNFQILFDQRSLIIPNGNTYRKQMEGFF